MAMHSLTNIVKEAYSLFGSYEVGTSLDVCTDCCMDLKDAESLARIPVSEIPWGLLRQYNDSAASQKTPIDEIKHFLPRYIEFIMDFHFPSHSTEITFRRFEPFLETEWTTEEFMFLQKFSEAFFSHCLQSYPLPENEEIDSILLMFWRGEFDIDRLLDLWLCDKSLSATLHFKYLYLEGFKLNNPYQMSSAFADENISKKLRNWLDAIEVKQFFAQNIETFILNDTEMEELHLNELNILYEILITPTDKSRQ